MLLSSGLAQKVDVRRIEANVDDDREWSSFGVRLVRAHAPLVEPAVRVKVRRTEPNFKKKKQLKKVNDILKLESALDKVAQDDTPPDPAALAASRPASASVAPGRTAPRGRVRR